VEELAYSQLLKGEWDEIKDVWVYLLIEAVQENNLEKLNQMAEIFDKVVSGLDTEDFVQNEQLQDNFYKFFRFLKESRGDKYRNCSKSFVKAVLAGKRMGPETKIGHLKHTLSEMSTQDLAATIWEEILYDDKFDSLSFSVFSKLVDKEQHPDISSSLKELFQSDNPLNRKPDVEMKLRLLLKGTSGVYISETYRQTLINLLRETSFEKRIVFDHHLLHFNYSYVLLNALEREHQKDAQTKYLERIQEEWRQISEDGNFEYIKDLLQVLKNKETDLAAEPVLQAAEPVLPWAN
jgi:predicted house-cleaning noncanonical NTP pyrophosphatase (MazG superfamily)